jgi:hypothetical protein
MWKCFEKPELFSGLMHLGSHSAPIYELVSQNSTIKNLKLLVLSIPNVFFVHRGTTSFSWENF